MGILRKLRLICFGSWFGPQQLTNQLAIVDRDYEFIEVEYDERRTSVWVPNVGLLRQDRVMFYGIGRRYWNSPHEDEEIPLEVKANIEAAVLAYLEGVGVECVIPPLRKKT